MQTIVLAAGRGTRMRPLTDEIPKPMLPVANRPLVQHVIDEAVDAGASEIILVVGYGASQIEDHFGRSYRDIPITYVYQETRAGTGHALATAKTALTNEPFVLLNGDIVVGKGELGPLYDDVPAVGAIAVDDPRSYGVFQLDGETVRGIVEKPEDPPSSLANAGAYSFPPSVLDTIDDLSASARGEYEITDVLDALFHTESVELVQFDRWLDVGRPWDLLEANEWQIGEVADSREGTISPDATVNGPVHIESGATVRSGVTIDGPVVIRRGATVGPNAFIRPSTLIDVGATVGHAVEIKNSVLFPNATIGHQSYVGDSLIGPEVNFGAGTNVANLRHDGSAIRTTVKGDVVSTGRRKFGVVAGPGAKTAIDTSLNAGVVLARDGTTRPNETLLRSQSLDSSPSE